MNTETLESMESKVSENLSKLPGLVKTGLSKAFETLLNQMLKLDEDLDSELKPLDEKVIQLTLKDISQTFFIIYQQQDEQGHFSVQTHLMGAPDCHIKTNLTNLMAKSNQPEMQGAPELGQCFMDALGNLEIDWEEQLSKLTGDLVAFKVGHAVRETQKTKQAAKQKAGETFKEYLQFEVNLAPTQSQVSRFSKHVSQTAEAVDALEARINALTSK